MLRSTLLGIGRRARQGAQEVLQGGAGPQAAALRVERVLSSSVAACTAAEEPAAAGTPAAAAHAAPAQPVASAAAAAAAAAAAQQQGLAAAPGIAKLLGFAGALPFLALSPTAAATLPLWFLDPSLVTYSGVLQIAYGATILSFLGGVHWGVAMTNIGGTVGAKLSQERYLWSVIPCLMGWPTLVMPLTHAAGVQAALLGVVYVVDRAWAKRGLLPPWYMALRRPLTALAATGLLATMALDVPPGVLQGIASG